MIDLSNGRQILNALLLAGVLALAIAALSTLTLSSDLQLLAVILFPIRTTALFGIIAPCFFIFGAKLPWYGRLGLGLFALCAAFVLVWSFQVEYRDWQQQEARARGEREASLVYDDLRAGSISKYRDRVGSGAVTQALERLLQDPLRPDQLHEVVKWYVADAYIMPIVSRNPLTPPGDLRDIADFYSQPRAHDSVTSWQETETLSNVARNPQTPPDALAKLLQTPFAAEAASNPACPDLERQRWLEAASHGDARHRAAAAASAYSPPNLLVAMAADPDAQVRALLAGNRASPPALLKSLASDPDGRIRQAIAANPSCTPALLIQLAVDPSPEVRRNVARNSSSSRFLITRLLKDSDPMVREQAQSSSWGRQVDSEDARAK